MRNWTIAVGAAAVFATAGQAGATTFTFSGELQKQTITGGAAADPILNAFDFATPVQWSATFDVGYPVGSSIWEDGLASLTIGGESFNSGASAVDLAGGAGGAGFIWIGRDDYAPDHPGNEALLVEVDYQFANTPQTISINPTDYLSSAPFIRVSLFDDLGDIGVTYSNQNGPSVFDRSQQNLPVIVGGPVISGIPEPSVWALLVSGFGVAGAVLRGRRKSAGARLRTA